MGQKKVVFILKRDEGLWLTYFFNGDSRVCVGKSKNPVECIHSAEEFRFRNLKMSNDTYSPLSWKKVDPDTWTAPYYPF